MKTLLLSLLFLFALPAVAGEAYIGAGISSPAGGYYSENYDMGYDLNAGYSFDIGQGWGIGPDVFFATHTSEFAGSLFLDPYTQVSQIFVIGMNIRKSFNLGILKRELVDLKLGFVSFDLDKESSAKAHNGLGVVLAAGGDVFEFGKNSLGFMLYVNMNQTDQVGNGNSTYNMGINAYYRLKI